MQRLREEHEHSLAERRHELELAKGGIVPLACRWLGFHYREAGHLEAAGVGHGKAKAMLDVERKALFRVVQQEAEALGLRCAIVGGSRRGTLTSHDVDILLCPDPDKPPFRDWKPNGCARQGCTQPSERS